jgi:polyphosphate kinase 2 (PPK2 family)
MLEQVDLTQKLSRTEYKSVIGEMRLKLGDLQRQAKDTKIPIIVVFEGWDAAGKGTLINQLMQALDPRGFNVYPTNPPTKEERLRPFLWRFWCKTPEKGRIAIFDRSWYGRVLVERVDKVVPKKSWALGYDEIKSFERQLTDAGNIIVKFFLHITKKEQKKRFEKIEQDPALRWKVTKTDWRHHRQYDKYLRAAEEMLAKTDNSNSPWTIVEAHDRRFAAAKILGTMIQSLDSGIAKAAGKKRPSHPTAAGRESSTSVLDKVDLSLELTEEEYQTKIKNCQQRIREIEHEVYKRRLPVIILYEGWDAAGKGGNIRRMTEEMDPRGYEVVPFAAPNEVELAHHYLWRFWKSIPKAGHITIFDRSWYGRVMVERVEGFCTQEDWKRAFQEINEMEAQFTHYGVVLVKFWLQIDQATQLSRFKERQEVAHKQWKITDEDWRNRKKWSRYKEAVNEMLFRTSTAYAPWTIVESNCKYFARVKTLETVIKAVEQQL